ncbi:MAG: histidine ammonia-lyase [Bacteroidia bacterium]
MTTITQKETLHLTQLAHILNQPQHLDDAAKQRVQASRKYLEDRLGKAGKPIYGVNTGFGFLANTEIEDRDLGQLQTNLIRSHACGTGEEVPAEIVKLMLLLKVRSLSLGHSGIRLVVVERLLDMFNEGILPVVYTQGSLGASGDLAPLAHLSLPLIGEGEVIDQGERMPAAQALEKRGWKPLSLKAKEGLALLNGTQFMSAYGSHIALKARKLADWADRLAALSLDGFGGLISPFDPLLHEIRPHAGQITVAENIRKLLDGSPHMAEAKEHVQDAYSFRCVPQVHGASRDALDYTIRTLEIEINSVTDNPTVFAENDRILSGGNFHGQPLALSMDFVAIAIAEWASISERRSYQLLSGCHDLPLFLVAEPGLNSGLMIAQYTAASIVSQNKQLCTPASVDTIPSSNNQEDHVSMGANAATKCLRVLENLEKVLAIELLHAAQAMHFRRPKQTSPALEEILAAFHAKVPPITQDRILHYDIEKARQFLKDWK